jgi:hypothetical protein
VIATSFATVMQAALIPVASSVGTDLTPAVRAPLDTMVHWGTGGRPTRRQPRPTRPALRALLTEVAGNATGSLSSARRTRPGHGEQLGGEMPGNGPFPSLPYRVTVGR